MEPLIHRTKRFLISPSFGKLALRTGRVLLALSVASAVYLTCCMFGVVGFSVSSELGSCLFVLAFFGSIVAFFLMILFRPLSDLREDSLDSQISMRREEGKKDVPTTPRTPQPV